MYDTRTVGFVGFVPVCGTDTVDAPRPSLPEPSPTGTASSRVDLTLELLLPGALPLALLPPLDPESC